MNILLLLPFLPLVALQMSNPVYDGYDYARPPYIDHPWTSTQRSAPEGLTDPIRTISHLELGNQTCMEYKFKPEDVQLKFLSILPYFATDDISKSMLHNLSGTLRTMSEDRSKNVRDTSFLASVLMPVIFMGGTKDTWCFIDRGAYGASVSYLPIEEGPINLENSNTINRNLIRYVNELVDGASTPFHALVLQQASLDLAAQPDEVSQSIAAAQTLGIVGELVSPVAGDTCGYSQLVDSYINYHTTGNRAALLAAIDNYANSLNQAVDRITLLRTNPSALRNQGVSVGACAGGGRSYGHDQVWDLALINSENPAHADLINEQLCSSRRLYNAWDRRSNAVAAAASAAITGPGHQVVRPVLPLLITYWNTVLNGGNAAAVGHQLKQELTQSATNMKSKY